MRKKYPSAADLKEAYEDGLRHSDAGMRYVPDGHEDPEIMDSYLEGYNSEKDYLCSPTK